MNASNIMFLFNHLFLVSLIFTFWTILGEAKDFCSTESFHARCSAGSVVVMTSARYGRMRLGRCVRIDFGFIGCSSDVLPVLDRICSGRQECAMRVPDAELDATKPCLGDLTRYLEVTYDCVAVQAADSIGCSHGTTKLPLPQPSGFLLGPSTNVGGLLSCARFIVAQEGQKVNLTLYDFGMATTEATVRFVQGGPSQIASGPSPKPETVKALVSARLTVPVPTPPPAPPELMMGVVCRRLALVTDLVAKTDVDICASPIRISHAYITAGHALEIRLLRDSSVDRHFMIHYDVIGCREPKLPSSYWIKKNDGGATMTIGCFTGTNGRTWQIACKNRTWIGDVGNCTDDVPEALTSSPTRTVQDEMRGVPPKLPTGLAAFIIVAIALSVGLCVTTVGFVVIRKYRQLSRGHPVSLITTSHAPTAEDLLLKRMNFTDVQRDTDCPYGYHLRHVGAMTTGARHASGVAGGYCHVTRYRTPSESNSFRLGSDGACAYRVCDSRDYYGNGFHHDSDLTSSPSCLLHHQTLASSPKRVHQYATGILEPDVTTTQSNRLISGLSPDCSEDELASSERSGVVDRETVFNREGIDSQMRNDTGSVGVDLGTRNEDPALTLTTSNKEGHSNENHRVKTSVNRMFNSSPVGAYFRKDNTQIIVPNSWNDREQIVGIERALNCNGHHNIHRHQCDINDQDAGQYDKTISAANDDECNKNAIYASAVSSGPGA